MKAELLHVVTAISNPLRWNSRERLYKDFETHMLDSGVNLTVVECQYGERPHNLIPTNKFVNHIPVRAKTMVWNKENLLNLGIQRIPEAKYIAWVDADIQFRKNSWAADTVNALQHYDVVQPWVDAIDLGPKGEIIQTHKSFCHQYFHGHPVIPTGKKHWRFNGGPYDYPHPGFCWAITRIALEWLGGLFELAAMGAGDHHMAHAFIGQVERSLPGKVHPNYFNALKQWESRAVHHINGNLGFVHGAIEHFFHGKKVDRKYVDRWEMILEHNFDPYKDLKKNSHGVLELSGSKPGLKRDLDLYFRQRNEDINSL